MILYAEDSKESHLLESTIKFFKVTKYKANIQKLIVFLDDDHGHAETKIESIRSD